jgi:DHA1 family tetracycline resistance protein-like MFS transporter
MKRSPLLIIFTTVFIDLVGFGIVIPVLPFYVEGAGSRFHATPRMVGLLIASYSIMQLIFSPILGRLSDKYGRRPVLLYSVMGTVISFLILGFAWTMWILFLGRILDGISGGNISTAQAYIADVTTPENRAKGMGLVGAAFGLGFIFGPFLGGVLSRWGAAVPFFFAAGLSFCNAILIYFTLPETVTDEMKKREEHTGLHWTQRWIELFASIRNERLGLILLIYFLLIVAFSIMTTDFALYTQLRFNYDAVHNGNIFAFIGVIAVIMQGLLFGRLARWFGEAWLVVIGTMLLAGSLFALPYVGPAYGGVVALLGISGVLAIGNSLAAPALTTLSSKSAGTGGQGATLGVAQSAASAARAVGPLLAAWLIHSATAERHMDDHSIRITFWVAAAITLAAGLLAAYYLYHYSGVDRTRTRAEPVS